MHQGEQPREVWNLIQHDVGPFPHGTQAREFELMVKYGMTPLAAIRAGTLNGAALLGWQGPKRRDVAELGDEEEDALDLDVRAG